MAALVTQIEIMIGTHIVRMYLSSERSDCAAERAMDSSASSHLFSFSSWNERAR